jgi:hypothetical protein
MTSDDRRAAAAGTATDGSVMAVGAGVTMPGVAVPGVAVLGVGGMPGTVVSGTATASLTPRMLSAAVGEWAEIAVARRTCRITARGQRGW